LLLAEEGDRGVLAVVAAHLDDVAVTADEWEGRERDDKGPLAHPAHVRLERELGLVVEASVRCHARVNGLEGRLLRQKSSSSSSDNGGGIASSRRNRPRRRIRRHRRPAAGYKAAMSLLAGRRLLVTGVLTDRSIAFAVAAGAQREGAEVVLTGFGRSRRLTERMARRLPQPADVLELDVDDDAHLAA